MKKKAYTGSFAAIYDDVMNTVPYDLWHNYLHELLTYYKKQPGKMADLACGTGNMTLRFAREGKEVVGVDRSREMLKIATRKAARENVDVSFVEADLRDFSLSQSFNFVFSLFDSLNYILSLEELTDVFANVYQILKEDGIFIFDMNTIQRLMSIEPGTTIFNGDNYSCFWRDVIDRENIRWQVELKIYMHNDKTRAYKEVHEETSYPLADIKNALLRAGFVHVDVYKAYTLDKGTDSDNRLYFAAFKEEPETADKSFIENTASKLKWRFRSFFKI